MRRIFTRDRVAARRRRFIIAIALVMSSAAVAFAFFVSSYLLPSACLRQPAKLRQNTAVILRIRTQGPDMATGARRDGRPGSCD